MPEQDKKLNKSLWRPGFLSLPNLRDLILIFILGVVFWKLLGAQINLNLQQFIFSDFLFFFLALFAVSLSVAFYFKATDTSNKFYDNVYKFTKEVSEILGRIEAGFGERLRHLDEGYTGLRDRFESLPFDVDAARKQEKEEIQEVKKKEKEFQKIISDLMERASVAEDDRSSLLDRLESAQEEANLSRRELNRLQRRIREAEADDIDIHPDFISDLAKLIDGHLSSKYANVPIGLLRRRFAALIEKNLIPKSVINYMQVRRLLDNDDVLTTAGFKVVRIALERNR